jgi:hypothetical protein
VSTAIHSRPRDCFSRLIASVSVPRLDKRCDYSWYLQTIGVTEKACFRKCWTVNRLPTLPVPRVTALVPSGCTNPPHWSPLTRGLADHYRDCRRLASPAVISPSRRSVFMCTSRGLSAVKMFRVEAGSMVLSAALNHLLLRIGVGSGQKRSTDRARS